MKESENATGTFAFLFSQPARRPPVRCCFKASSVKKENRLFRAAFGSKEITCLEVDPLARHLVYFFDIFSGLCVSEILGLQAYGRWPALGEPA